MALPNMCCNYVRPGLFHDLVQIPVPFFPPLSVSRASLASQKLRVSASLGAWKEIIDPASGQPYYWNTETNETTWQRPTNSRNEQRGAGETSNVGAELSLNDLANILLAAASADPSRFGDVANQYRPQCFEDGFFDHLGHMIKCTKDNSQREDIEKLRARLANPLLKNPPPF